MGGLLKCLDIARTYSDNHYEMFRMYEHFGSCPEIFSAFHKQNTYKKSWLVPGVLIVGGQHKKTTRERLEQAKEEVSIGQFLHSFLYFQPLELQTVAGKEDNPPTVKLLKR